MTDELKAAAERLRQMRAASNAYDGGYPDTPEGRWQSQMDHLALAEAYLSEHLPDEDEPADRAWRESVGFKTYDSPELRLRLPGGSWGHEIELLCGLYLSAYDDGDWFLDEAHWMTNPTRGQVRLLCHALCVTLEDGLRRDCGNLSRERSNMTDIERLKHIAENRAGYGVGLTEEVKEDFRFLLDDYHKCLQLLATLLIGEDVDAAREATAFADACRYTVPPKRCETCGGTGCVSWV